MTRFALSLLGPVQATLNGQLINHFAYDKVRALLVYLAVESGTAHARDALAGLLWPELPNAAARTNLRQALTTLRQAIDDLTADPPVLLITRETIQFNAVCDHTLDVTVFEALVAACERHPHRRAESCTSCARQRMEALALYRGDFLAQLYLADSASFEEWATLKRERLHAQARAALAGLTAYHERRGAHDEAQRYARRLVELEPWNEDAHQQLMRTLWLGGQRSAALAHYRQCCDLLQMELGIEPAPETTALYERIRANTPSTNAAPHRGAPPACALPAATTALLGREAELVHLADLLELRACRLLTLVGLGGVGKTRLALQVAADLAWAFADGAVFVALEAIVDPALVPFSIAQALGVPERSGQPILDRLGYVLRERELLLVLDNFEQVLSAAPGVAALLRAAPGLTVLVTSRAPLKLHAEQVVPVAPLATPDPHDLPDLAALAQVAAVALFLQRVQAVAPFFQLIPTTAPAVAAICARLDGVPLAIELAAARSTLLDPPALLARLQHRLELLTDGARDAPARQQTLRATIDWSYQLLDPADQHVFAHLAVFVGGWTLDAAEAICAAPGEASEAVLKRLQSLVEQHLVRHDAADAGPPRFRMVETIREYACERLAVRADAEAVACQYAAYYLALAEAAEPALRDGRQAAWGDRLEREYGNLRAALRWFIARGAAEQGLRMGGALWRFWRFHDHALEGRDLLAELLALPGGSAAARATALLGAGWLADVQWDQNRATALFQESAARYRAAGDRWGLAFALSYVGYPISWSREPIAESAALFEQLDEPWGLALACILRGELAGHQGDLRGLALAQEGVRRFRAIGDRWFLLVVFERLRYVAHPYALDDATWTARVLDEYLQLAREVGDSVAIAQALHLRAEEARWQAMYGQAAALYDEAIARLDTLGLTLALAAALHGRGMVAYHQGEDERAHALFAASLPLFHAAQHDGMGWCFEGWAGLAAKQGHARRAARLLAAGDVLCDFASWPVGNAGRTELDGIVAAARSQLDDAAWAAAWAEGRALTLEQAIAYALDEPADGTVRIHADVGPEVRSTDSSLGSEA